MHHKDGVVVDCLGSFLSARPAHELDHIDRGPAMEPVFIECLDQGVRVKLPAHHVESRGLRRPRDDYKLSHLSGAVDHLVVGKSRLGFDSCLVWICFCFKEAPVIVLATVAQKITRLLTRLHRDASTGRQLPRQRFDQASSSSCGVP